jgi:uncharacterized protein (TIGR01319 family)
MTHASIERTNPVRSPVEWRGMVQDRVESSLTTSGGDPMKRVPDDVVVCVDVGSTFTKAAAIGPRGAVLATAQHPTTSDTDVLEGLEAALAGLGLGRVRDASIVVCSSAGGGLRLAVVGHERVISAEAGRRVALSAGARVVAVSAGLLDSAGIEELSAARPDVVLVVGGTDGGDSEVLLHNSRVLGRSALRVPVVLAGNVEAADGAAALLGARRRVVLPTDNVIPRIGTLHPGPARRAIREVFITHVIGGKGLSRGRRFPRLVVCATPDAVLAGIEVVAEVLAGQPGARGDVMALDIGGATTDVYSVLRPDDGAPDEAVETLWHGRSVEGDLGMRWSARDVVDAALAERMREPGSGGGGAEALVAAAEVRRSDVGFLPVTAAQIADELELARLAAVIAARRHARPGAEGSRDLTHVGLLIGSGGVLRHADPAAALAVLDAVLTDFAGGWRLPERARVIIDRQYLLAPIGLLQLTGRPALARALAAELVSTPTSSE